MKPLKDNKMRPNIAYKEGDEFVHSYPFVRTTFQEFDGDGYSNSKTWAPGVRFEDRPNGDADTISDGLGFQKLTVIAVFKPGKYPARVFFTRRWIDPDGKEFGKTNLRICTVPAFRALTLGYRYRFDH